MANVLVDETSLQNIANAIREKNGTENTYKPSEMPQAILDIQTGGGGDNWYDTFWDNYQDYGNRVNYASVNTGAAFSGSGWNDITFKPKYDIVPEDSAWYLFAGSNISDFSNLDIKLDFSNCQDMRGCFSLAKATHIGVVNAGSVLYNWLQQSFYGCSNLKTIDKLILPTSTTVTGYLEAFRNCYALEDITVEGKFIKSISFSDSSKLTTASVDSIINALYDLTGQDSQTLTVHKAVFGRMSDEQKAFVTSKNWTLASSK